MILFICEFGNKRGLGSRLIGRNFTVYGCITFTLFRQDCVVSILIQTFQPCRIIFALDISIIVIDHRSRKVDM